MDTSTQREPDEPGGLTQAILSAMGVDDPTELGPDDLQRGMDEFNALPFEQRKAITEPAVAHRAHPRPTVGPVSLPSPDQVLASARATPVLETFARLADYFTAPGKVMTARGNLRIADARALTDLLETDDVYEDQVGDHSFRKQSATEFVDVDHWQWWASRAGVLRRRDNRLVAVKAWRQRVRRDPVAEASRAFDVLLRYGPLGSYQMSGSPLDALLDESVPLLLAWLLDDSWPTAYDWLLGAITRLIEDEGVEERYPGDFGLSLDMLLGILEGSGVIQQQDVEYAPGRSLADRVGGLVSLTPVGIHIAVRVVERAGVEVLSMPAAEDAHSDGLTGWVGDPRMDPEQWWTMVGSWTAAQPNARDALADLFGKLAEREPRRLALALDTCPDSEHASIEPVVRDLAFADDPEHEMAGSVALNWLIRQRLVDAASLDRARLVDAMVDVACLDIDDDEPGAVRFMGKERDGEEMLDMIAEVARRGRVNGERVLEAIGRHHPDARVSKAARKELFRARSR